VGRLEVSATPVALRPALPEDAPEIARLAGELGYEASAEQMQRRLERLCADATQFVCVASAEAARLLGWIHAAQTLVLESGEAVEILGLIVDPAARRRAVGRALVLAAEAWACASGAERIVVRSNAVRTESHTFYPALGYTLDKTQHVYRKRPNRQTQP
jgi:GNAT superfamily N-acetyltransferase